MIGKEKRQRIIWTKETRIGKGQRSGRVKYVLQNYLLLGDFAS